MLSSLNEKINQLNKECSQSLEEQKITEKNAILFIGETGVGKSTVVCYLAGCKMKRVQNSATGEVTIIAENPVTNIGDTGRSTTFCPKIFQALDHSVGLGDLPGFRDNRGPEYEIAGAIASRNIIKNLKELKGLVVLMSYQSIYDSRAEELIKLAEHLKEMWPMYESHANSFLFLITKLSENANLKIIQAKLKEIYEQTPSDNLRKLVQMMLIPEKLVMCDPLNIEARKQLLINFNSLIPIAERAEIKLSFSDEARLVLKESIADKEVQFNQTLSSFIRDIDFTYQNMASEILDIDALERLSTEITQLSSLTNQVKDLTTFQLFLFSIHSNLLERKKEIFTLVKQMIILKSYDNDNPALILNQEWVLSLADVTNKLIENIKSKIIQLALEEIASKLANPALCKYTEEIKNSLKNWIDNEDNTIPELFFKIDIITTINNIKNLFQKILTYQGLADLKTFLRNQFIQPIQIDYDKEKKYLCLKIIANVFSLSQSLIYASSYQAVERLELLTTSILLIDSDIKNDLWTGKNIILIADEIIIEQDYIFDVSAKNGHDALSEIAPALENSGTKAGDKGSDGSSATLAGNIILACKTKKGQGNITFLAKGGRGGNGQNGDEGAKGQLGKAGLDANDTDLFHEEDLVEIGDSKYKLYRGKQGCNGNPGGKGGDGGNAGLGSTAGKVTFIFDTYSEIKQENGSHGNRGLKGEGGKGGSGGRGGQHGFKKTITTSK
jgi:GTP-binding protein EngB required for normal cell division